MPAAAKAKPMVTVRIPEDQHFANASDGVRLALIWEKLKQIERKLAKK